MAERPPPSSLLMRPAYDFAAAPGVAVLATSSGFSLRPVLAGVLLRPVELREAAGVLLRDGTGVPERRGFAPVGVAERCCFGCFGAEGGLFFVVADRFFLASAGGAGGRGDEARGGMRIIIREQRDALGRAAVAAWRWWRRPGE